MTYIENAYVYAPHLYLIAFNLVSGKDSNFQNKSYDSGWINGQYQKIMEHFPSFKTEYNQKFKIRTDKPDEFIFSLLEEKKLLYLKPDENNQIIDQIIISPKQIKDSHSLQLAVLKKQNAADDKIKIEELDKFNPSNCLDIDTYLGKTLLFHCFIKPDQIKDIAQIAKACLEAILPEKKLPLFSKQYQLFGATAFVYGDFKNNQTESYTQVILLFFTEEINSEKFVKTYLDLSFSYLLLHFHKIVTEYFYGKQDYDSLDTQIGEIGEILLKLKNNYSTDTTKLDSTDTTKLDSTDTTKLDSTDTTKLDSTDTTKLDSLDNLKSILKSLLTINLEYSQTMRQLEYRLNTLEINLTNYKINLENLQLNIGDRLEYFQYILDAHLPLLQQELATKLKYISGGLTLTQEAVAIIRGLIEIDQAESDRRSQDLKQQELEQKEESDRLSLKQKEKSDRSLQITLTALGFGIGVGGIMASSSGQITQDNPIYLPGQPQADLTHIHPFTLIVIASVVLGILTGIFTKLILGRFLRVD